jgi:hypothetical protein
MNIEQTVASLQTANGAHGPQNQISLAAGGKSHG